MRLLLASAALLALSACATAPASEHFSGTYFTVHGAPYFTQDGSQRWVRVNGGEALAEGRVTVEGRLSPPIVHRRSNYNRRTLYVTGALESAAD
ncbi:MAG: hypothetical protein AB7J28_08525 [Hyphomonadaceae bacterium]